MKDIIKLFLLIIVIYLGVIILIPNVAKKVDETTNTKISGEISNKVRSFFGGVQSSTQNFIDNPAPNATKNINGRNNIK